MGCPLFRPGIEVNGRTVGTFRIVSCIMGVRVWGFLTVTTSNQITDILNAGLPIGSHVKALATGRCKSLENPVVYTTNLSQYSHFSYTIWNTCAPMAMSLPIRFSMQWWMHSISKIIPANSVLHYKRCNFNKSEKKSMKNAKFTISANSESVLHYEKHCHFQ